MIEEIKCCSNVTKKYLKKILRTLLNVRFRMFLLEVMLRQEIIAISLEDIEAMGIEIVISILN